MKKLLLKLIGPLFAAVGVFGLAGSGIVWNFQGRSIGFPSTVLSLLALILGIVLLRPLARSSASVEGSVPPESVVADLDLDLSDVNAKPILTTAESIAQQLAESQQRVEPTAQVNFAPEMLLPGQGVLNRRRSPGASLKRYKAMAGELFTAN